MQCCWKHHNLAFQKAEFFKFWPPLCGCLVLSSVLPTSPTHLASGLVSFDYFGEGLASFSLDSELLVLIIKVSRKEPLFFSQAFTPAILKSYNGLSSWMNLLRHFELQLLSPQTCTFTDLASGLVPERTSCSSFLRKCTRLDTSTILYTLIYWL